MTPVTWRGSADQRAIAAGQLPDSVPTRDADFAQGESVEIIMLPAQWGLDMGP